MKNQQNGNGSRAIRDNIEDDETLGDAEWYSARQAAQATRGHSGRREPRNPAGAGLKRQNYISACLDDLMMDRLKMGASLLDIGMSELLRGYIQEGYAPILKYIDAALAAKHGLQQAIQATQDRKIR